MAITIENKFLTLKDEFKSDTGLEFNKENMEFYTQYFNARCSDITCQVIYGLASNLFNRLNEMPGQTRLEFADMLRTHEVIKDLLKK